MVKPSGMTDKNTISGVVIEALRGTQFKVKLSDQKTIVTYLSGKMRLHHITIVEGDKVDIVLSSDGLIGRIVARK